MSSSSINWGIHWDTDSITNHTIHLILWQAASSIIAAHLCHCPLLFSPVVPVYIIKMHVLINITFLHLGEGLSSCNNHSLSQLRLSCACCLYNATTWGTWFKIINIVSFCLLLVMIIYFKLLILKLKDNIIVVTEMTQQTYHHECKRCLSVEKLSYRSNNVGKIIRLTS